LFPGSWDLPSRFASTSSFGAFDGFDHSVREELGGDGKENGSFLKEREVGNGSGGWSGDAMFSDVCDAGQTVMPFAGLDNCPTSTGQTAVSMLGAMPDFDQLLSIGVELEIFAEPPSSSSSSQQPQRLGLSGSGPFGSSPSGSNPSDESLCQNMGADIGSESAPNGESPGIQAANSPRLASRVDLLQQLNRGSGQSHLQLDEFNNFLASNPRSFSTATSVQPIQQDIPAGEAASAVLSVDKIWQCQTCSHQCQTRRQLK
jgi:hypothetical protein